MLRMRHMLVCKVQHADHYQDQTDNHGYKALLIALELVHYLVLCHEQSIIA